MFDYLDDEKLKSQFAYEWLRNPNDAFAAALTVFKGDTTKALQASTKWQFCPFVNCEKQRLLAELGDGHFLPTKAQFARRILDLVEKGETDTDEKIKLLRLYADTMGYIEKPVAVTAKVQTQATINKELTEEELLQELEKRGLPTNIFD